MQGKKGVSHFSKVASPTSREGAGRFPGSTLLSDPLIRPGPAAARCSYPFRPPPRRAPASAIGEPTTSVSGCSARRGGLLQALFPAWVRGSGSRARVREGATHFSALAGSRALLPPLVSLDPHLRAITVSLAPWLSCWASWPCSPSSGRAPETKAPGTAGSGRPTGPSRALVPGRFGLRGPPARRRARPRSPAGEPRSQTDGDSPR